MEDGRRVYRAPGGREGLPGIEKRFNCQAVYRKHVVMGTIRS